MLLSRNTGGLFLRSRLRFISSKWFCHNHQSERTDGALHLKAALAAVLASPQLILKKSSVTFTSRQATLIFGAVPWLSFTSYHRRPSLLITSTKSITNQKRNLFPDPQTMNDISWVQLFPLVISFYFSKRFTWMKTEFRDIWSWETLLHFQHLYRL